MPAPAIGVRRFAPSSLPQVDWSHPLAMGLNSAVLPGSAPVDLVTGKIGTISTGTIGAGAAGLGRAGYIEFAAADKPVVPPPFSVFAVVNRAPVLASGQAAAFVSFGGSGTGRGWQFGTYATGGFNYANLTFGGVAVYGASSNWVNGAFGVSAGASVTGNGGTVTLYDGGRRIHNATVGTMQSPTKGLLIGSAHSSTTYVDTMTTEFVIFAAVWSRALSHAEHALLAANPFCFLRF